MKVYLNQPIKSYSGVTWLSKRSGDNPSGESKSIGGHPRTIVSAKNLWGTGPYVAIREALLLQS